MKVVFSAAAKRDVVEIGRYIAMESPLQSRAVVAQIYERAYGLAQFPRSCPTIASVRDDALRKLMVSNYNVLCAIRTNRIQISHVIHGSRDIARIIFGMADEA